MGKHPQPVVQITMKFHKTNGTEPVKPGVRHLLHQLRKAQGFAPLHQPVPWPCQCAVKAVAINLHHRAADHRLRDLQMAFFIGADAEPIQTTGDRFHKLTTSL